MTMPATVVDAHDRAVLVQAADNLEHALSAFGADRLMYGGDWPFALLAASSYTQIFQGLSRTVTELTEDQRAAVMGGTALRVYRLEDGR